MNCKAMESLIALYIEGDIPASDLRRIESHLHGCITCSGLVDELRESQSMFKALRAGTVNSSDLAGVRSRVLNEVGDLDPAPGWVLTMHRLIFAGLRRRNAIAGFALVVLVSGSVWYAQKSVVREVKNEAPVDVARMDAPAEFLSPILVPPSVEAPRVLKRTVMQEIPVEALSETPASAEVLEPTPQQIQVSEVATIKFVTDDPDIIIYWLPSDKGD